MKALVKFCPGPDGLKIMDMPEPVPLPGELKIEVYAAGICGTDLHIMHDEYPCEMPVILGHEYAGVVTEMGSDVHGFSLGDKVVSLTAARTCGTCRYCTEELPMLCDERKSIGYGIHGAFAKYITIPAWLALKVADALPFETAAICEPLACVVHGVIERSDIKAGDYVLVSGPGTIGQLAAQVAKTCGAQVAVAGTAQDCARLALAMSLGADATLQANTDTAEQTAKAFTQGNGFDVAIECAGAAASAAFCLRALRKNSLYAQLGIFGKTISFDMDMALFKEIRITNSFGTKSTSWVTALRLLEAGRITVAPLTSKKFPLEEWQTAFARAQARQGYKILLSPNM